MSVEKARQLYENFLTKKKEIEVKKTDKLKALIEGKTEEEDFTDFDSVLLNLAELTAGAMYDEINPKEMIHEDSDAT